MMGLQMRIKLPMLYKLVLLISLIIIPFYIHCARIDRILNQYTTKSNAIYIILHEQESKIINPFVQGYVLFQRPVTNICHTYIFLHSIDLLEIESVDQIKILYLNSDLPPPVHC